MVVVETAAAACDAQPTRSDVVRPARRLPHLSAGWTVRYEESLRHSLVKAAGRAPICRPDEGCPICDARREADAKQRASSTDYINEEWAADKARVAEIEADDTLSDSAKFVAIAATLMRNNGGQPHGLRNVWTGRGEPPSGFGYYDTVGRRNR